MKKTSSAPKTRSSFFVSSQSVKKKSLLVVSMGSMMASNVFASGIFLQEAVIANAGTTGAGDGVYTKSAAAMWTNPATMSFMGDRLTTINTTLFDLEMKYTDESGSGNSKASTTMPSVGVFHVQQLNDDVHLGIAFGIAGGSTLDYGTQWQGAALMTDISLMAAQINPTLSFRVTEKMSWGIGAQFSWATLGMGMGAGFAELEQSSDWAYGFTAGVLYQIDDQWDVGIGFRSKVEHEFSTKLIGPGAKNPSVASDLDVPAIIDVSTSYAATQDLKLLASLQLHRWSDWEETVFDFGKLDSNPLGFNSIDRQWDDVWKLAIGADYQWNADWRLKAGFSYESSPQDDPTKQWVDLPVGKQYRYSVGATTKWDDYTFDIFYEYADLGSVDIEKRQIAPNQSIGVNGAFDGRVHFIGLSVSF